MPRLGCAASESRDVTVADVACPACGAMVELFSDEQRRTCHECGGVVERQIILTCASWCASAEKCLGSARFQELIEQGAITPKPAPPQE
jgi:hypothetical protein